MTAMSQSRNQLRFCVIIALGLCASRPASAYLQSVLPLDMVAEEAAVILKVTASDLTTVQPFPEFDSFSFVGQRVYVLKTDRKVIPEKQTFQTYGQVAHPWRFGTPEDRTLLLFLERDTSDHLQIINDVHAVLPVPDFAATADPNPEHYHKALFDEFNHAANASDVPSAKARFISFAAQFATLADLARTESRGTGSDLLVLLAAALATAKVEPTVAHVQAVLDLLQRQARTEAASKQEISGEIFSDLELAARSTSMKDSEALRKRMHAYLPIYRYLLDRMSDSCVNEPYGCFGMSWGIRAIAEIGTEDDFPRLWRFHAAKANYSRYDCLEGLSRILGKPTKHPPIHNDGAGDVIDEVQLWETQTLETIKGAMLRKGLLQ